MTEPTTSENWFKHPRKKHVIFVAGSWLAGMVLLGAASTDFFTAPANAKGNAMLLLLLVLPATWSLVEIVANYYRSRRPA